MSKFDIVVYKCLLTTQSPQSLSYSVPREKENKREREREREKIHINICYMNENYI